MNYLPYQNFLYDCEVRNLSPKTIKSYINMTLLFLKYCDEVKGKNDVEEIGKIDLQSFMRMKRDAGCKVKYINSILRVVRAFFSFLEEEKYIRDNSITKVKFLKTPQTIIEIYTDEEVKQLLSFYSMSDYLSARNKVLISLQLDTGIRCTETILIKNIDMYENRILINGKGNKQRLVPISPTMYKLLKKYQCIKRNYFYGKDYTR